MNHDTYKIVMTRRAKQDIIDIGDHITYTLLEPGISGTFIHNLRNAISKLSTFPYKYPLIHDDILAKQNIHCMPYRNYYVFYQVSDNQNLVIIIRIGYKRRNWKSILKR